MNLYYWLGYQLSRLVGRLFFRLRVIHPERMLQDGPVILAMNHQSYLDPPLAGTTCDRAIHFLARRTLLDEIGRASCRERGEIRVVSGEAKKEKGSVAR